MFPWRQLLHECLEQGGQLTVQQVIRNSRCRANVTKTAFGTMLGGGESALLIPEPPVSVACRKLTQWQIQAQTAVQTRW